MENNLENEEKDDINFVEEDSGSEIADKIKKIKEELKGCRKNADEYLAGWQRAKADLINSRKDEEKRRESIIKYANERLLYEILDILDGLEKALSQPDLAEQWKTGFGNIRNKLLQIARGYGLSLIESEGGLFNPAEHESVAEEEVSNPDQDQKILAEIQKGYKIYDKVLRPVKVKIGIYKLVK
ncbi:MAG: nucleotide exchange factor GrpE [Patescibacteria group bacterium]